MGDKFYILEEIVKSRRDATIGIKDITDKLRNRTGPKGSWRTTDKGVMTRPIELYNRFMSRRLTDVSAVFDAVCLSRSLLYCFIQQVMDNVPAGKFQAPEDQHLSRIAL